MFESNMKSSLRQGCHEKRKVIIFCSFLYLYFHIYPNFYVLMGIEQKTVMNNTFYSKNVRHSICFQNKNDKINRILHAIDGLNAAIFILLSYPSLFHGIT